MTPVKVDIFEEKLREAKYNKDKITFLINGFKNGFELQYQGPSNVRRTAPNLKLRVGSKLELWNKVMVEVAAGPFEEVPFRHFIQSPIGLVLKDKGKKTRLIFHLSCPKDGKSVNSGIPKEYCSVKYPDFVDAVQMCIKAGKGCKIAKSDMSMPFRNVPMSRRSWKYLVMKAEHPITGKVWYFVDKCLPFGSSISCAIFQEFSNAVAHLVRFKTLEDVLNYLDDYFFAAVWEAWCNAQVQAFLDVCMEISFPVALEKKVWGTTLLTFLGLLIDTERQTICIPFEKVQKAMKQIDVFWTKKNKSVTVLQVQKLCRLLNFLCKCVVPGRVFSMRLHAMTAGKTLKQYHHVRVSEENRMDLQVWKKFLQHPQVFCRPFLDLTNEVDSQDIDMYSDAARSFRRGFGAYCGSEWCFWKWTEAFPDGRECLPSIEYLQLFAVTAAMLKWIKKLQKQKCASVL